jgi:citrate lyase subunit beta/citryl-CoA lyase
VVLLDILDDTLPLPAVAPCEHIAGNEKFIRKAFELQSLHVAPNGASFIDVTLDLEDGAPVGEEGVLRTTCIRMLRSTENRFSQAGVRVHAPRSPHFLNDLTALLGEVGDAIAYITIPKIESASQVVVLQNTIAALAARFGLARTIPLHILIETPSALREVHNIAAIPQVQVLDFGLMDFISHLGGAISSACMRSPGQFDHHLLRHSKEQICMAALGAGKTPSHNVTVDVKDPEQAYRDARVAREQFGFLRMWSIHPGQVEPIIRALVPQHDEVHEARKVLEAAKAASWGPISLEGRLHDRASYRYYASVLQRAGSVHASDFILKRDT